MARPRRAPKLKPPKPVRRGPLAPADEDSILNPFTVLVDQNEFQHATDWKFQGLRANADQENRLILVPLAYTHLGKGHGDYQVEGFPGYCVERKTKSDLFGSMAHRENFLERMAIMSGAFRVASIVVEAELSEILDRPPTFVNPKTGLRETYPPVKSVLRTVQAWTIRFPNVHWDFLPDRDHAEAWTFRLLDAHYKSQTRPAEA